MDPIGRVLGGRYRIVRGIGAGGMGSVYEAIQEGIGRRVAVKVIAEQLVAEPLYLERFRREAMAAAQLGHPNVVPVIDFQHDPGEPPFLVMELLVGEPLKQRLQRGPIDPELAVDITLQVLAGLDAAHAHGIVHRDIKPGNVFLVPMGAGRVLARVLDFGIAKLMDSETYGRLTATGILVGTPRYAAPEQITDSKSVDPRTDVYGAGALLYCMLAGRPPHMSRGAQLLVDIQEREPRDPRVHVPQMSPGLVEVMRRAMQKSRERRFQSARDFAEALSPFAGPAATDRGAPPTRPTAIVAPRTMTLPTHAQPRAEEEPTWPPGSRPARPTHAASGSRANFGVAAGTAIGVVLGALLLAAVGGAIWLGGRDVDRSTRDEPAEPPIQVPAECREWERIACRCSSQEVVSQYCDMARARNIAIADGDAPTWDCPRLLDAMRSACPAYPAADSPAPDHPWADPGRSP